MATTYHIIYVVPNPIDLFTKHPVTHISQCPSYTWSLTILLQILVYLWRTMVKGEHYSCELVSKDTSTRSHNPASILFVYNGEVIHSSLSAVLLWFQPVAPLLEILWVSPFSIIHLASLLNCTWFFISTTSSRYSTSKWRAWVFNTSISNYLSTFEEFP